MLLAEILAKGGVYVGKEDFGGRKCQTAEPKVRQHTRISSAEPQVRANRTQISVSRASENSCRNYDTAPSSDTEIKIVR